MTSFTFIEGCNYRDCPIGGQLSSAKKLVGVYGDTISLVGTANKDDHVVGKWTTINVDGTVIRYFPFRRLNCSTDKPLVPERIWNYIGLLRYKKAILKGADNNVFVQSPEILMAISGWEWSSICYRFAGVENALTNPRYTWGKCLSRNFEKRLFNKLQSVDVILASADIFSINKMVDRSDGLLGRKDVIQFPTRVDTEFYRPLSPGHPHLKLLDGKDRPVLVTCGRINRVKGWKLLVDSFVHILDRYGDAKLIFVGDGEDRKELENYIEAHRVSDHVTITGFVGKKAVRAWLNHANVVLVGSQMEGWSVSMLETLACGKPIVSTNVSGASEMIIDGANGYVVSKRSPLVYAEKAIRALGIIGSQEVSLSIANKYSISTLRHDLNNVWLNKIQ